MSRDFQVVSLLRERVVGCDVLDQEAIDKALTASEDAPANGVLAVSVACCKAAASHAGVLLHEHIGQLAGILAPAVPMPFVALVNGGQYAHASVTQRTRVTAKGFSKGARMCIHL